MARMSIDDLFLRDPRVRALATELGWSKYEARGRLLDVFAVAYDRVDTGGDPVLTAREIDIAAEWDGLADAMVKHNLAAPTRNGLRIRGTERTKYLATRESSGRAGGIKSGESRRKKAKLQTKVTFAENEGPLNPSVPDPVPDLPSVPDPDLSRASPARAIPPSTPPPAYDQESPRDRGRLAEYTYRRLSELRVQLAAELGIVGVLPLPVGGVGAEPRGFRDLRERIREEGAAAPQVCDRVLEVLVAQARDARSLEWLSDKALTAGAWSTARNAIPGWRAPPRAGPRSTGAIGAATPRSDHAIGSLEGAALVAAFGMTPDPETGST
jgi:hypothetical protein